MNTRGRFGFGMLFVAVGVAVWTQLLWAYEPVGRSSAPSAVEDPFGFMDWLSSGRDLRLSALVLGAGGLLITARGWRPGGWLSLALGVAWLALDISLDVADVRSVVPVAVAGLTVAAAATAIIVASARRSQAAAAGRTVWLLVYAGVAIGVATPGVSFDRTATSPGHVLIFAAVLVSALVAAAAVNPTGSPTTGRWPAAMLIALAVALYLWRYTGWGPTPSPESGSTWFWWQEAGQLATVLPSPLVAAAAVALTGVAGRRRWPVAIPVIVLALLPASMARSMPPLPGLPAFVSGQLLDVADGRRQLPAQLIGGLAVGVSAWVLARLAPVLFGPAPTTAGAPRSAAPRHWTTAVGLGLAAAGVVSWAVAEAVVAPAARAVDHGQPISIHITAPLIGWAANLRWGAILLAWGGLLLGARRRGRPRWLAAGVVVWFAADLVLAVIGVRGWLAASICAVVAGFGLFVVALTRAPAEGVPPGSVGFAAAAAGAGIHVMAIKASMSQYLPSWAFQLGLAVSLLLVVVAVVHSLTTEIPVRARHVVGAVVVAVAGFAGAVLHYATARQESDRGSDLAVQLTLVAAVAVAATACALSSAPGRWWAATGAVVLVVIGTLPLFLAAVMLAYLPQDIAFALDGLLGLTGEWFSDPVAGAVFGAAVALLALWPTALSNPDSPLGTEPPPSLELPGPPQRRSPPAVPGVPEVLSWPPDPSAVPVR